MIRFFSERKAYFILEALVILALIISGYSAYRAMTLKQGEQVTIPGGVTVAKPANTIVDAILREDGFLVVKFDDGTTKEIGYVRGSDGQDGESISPTQAQVAVAVADYCATNNRCDAKAPTVDQVAFAVAAYCSTRNECIGATGQTGATGTNGTNGTNATAEQIMAAVTEYCSDGRCRGPEGPQGIQGIAGPDGKDPVISCVERNNTQYVAWKYNTEEDSAYRDLYQLPPLTQGQNCIVLS